MANTYIVGSGFSGFYASQSLSKKYIWLSCGESYKRDFEPRRKYLEINKLLRKKIASYGNINFSSSQLHERVVDGGNSTLWGGFINMDHDDERLHETFKNNHIETWSLSYEKNHAITNGHNIRQLVLGNRILDVSKLASGTINGRAVSIDLKKRELQVFYSEIDATKSEKYEEIYLATGVCKTIEILYESGLINNGDKISLEEYAMQYRVSTSGSIRSDEVVIKYNFCGIIKHFFGVTNPFKCWIKVPLYLEQIFSQKLVEKGFTIASGSLISSQSEPAWGKSIHYCNLKINGVEINQHLRQIGSNIFVISQCGVSQSSPGPISNDIVKNINQIINA